ncbi:hypothetical protein SKB0092_28600 [Roseomonas mucosa]
MAEGGGQDAAGVLRVESGQPDGAGYEGGASGWAFATGGGNPGWDGAKPVPGNGGG